MKALQHALILNLFSTFTMTLASPSETNILEFNFSGNDAVRFRNTEVHKSSTEYGPNKDHIMHDYVLSFSKDLGEDGYKLILNLECQQRFLDYQLSPKAITPTCSFTTFVKAPKDVSTNSSLLSYTYIQMSPEIAKQMVQKLSWNKHKNGSIEFFGCYDGKISGCPTIRYTPESDTQDASIDIKYYKK